MAKVKRNEKHDKKKYFWQTSYGHKIYVVQELK